MIIRESDPFSREVESNWEDWALRLPERFDGMDALSALYLETKEPKYAEAVSRAFRQSYSVKSQETVKADPLRWQIGALTQHILSQTSARCVTRVRH